MTPELFAAAVVVVALAKVVASAWNARAEREEAKRIAWKYFTRPTTVTQPHKGLARVIKPPAANVQPARGEQ